MSTVIRSARGADIHSSLRLLRVLESTAKPRNHFKIISHRSPRAHLCVPGAAAHWRTEKCSCSEVPLARGTLHSRCANHPRSRLAFTGWDRRMGAWIATNSSIAIRTEASKCSSPCSRGLLGSHSSPFTSALVSDTICSAHSVTHSRPAICAE